MLFAYLDEFGHQGPFVARTDPRFNESPVFGMAGIILPGCAVRPFATRFLQLKEKLLAEDIAKANKMAAKWEKKGTDLFRPRAIQRYPSIREGGFRLLNYVQSCGGKVFFYGREKIKGATDVNSNGLYTTVLSKTIRRIDDYATKTKEDFVMVVDQHSARKELLECAAKTMFGSSPARRLVSPPFEVESYLNQNIQAADWVATIIARIWNYRLEPEQYKDHEQITNYFGDRIARLTAHSAVERRKAAASTREGSEFADPSAKKTLRYSVLDPAPKAANLR